MKKAGGTHALGQAMGLFHYTFLHSHNLYGAFASGGLLHLVAHR